jgi:hypothetical protein
MCAMKYRIEQVRRELLERIANLDNDWGWL